MRRFWTVFCWIPLAVHAGMLFYVNQFDGWGQWAAAPMLLLPLGLSLIWTIVGGVLLAAEPPSRQEAIMMSGAMLLAAAPWLITIGRAIAR